MSLVILMAMASCGPSRKTRSRQTGDPDGSSLQQAIRIEPIAGKQGVDGEYDWLADHYPGWRTRQQTRIQVKKKYYDVLEIDNIKGANKVLYFDISRAYSPNR